MTYTQKMDSLSSLKQYVHIYYVCLITNRFISLRINNVSYSDGILQNKMIKNIQNMLINIFNAVIVGLKFKICDKTVIINIITNNMNIGFHRNFLIDPYLFLFLINQSVSSDIFSHHECFNIASAYFKS